jgi:HSP20 family molecular chaperone IbpA
MAEETKGLQVPETEKQEILENDAERTRSRPAFVPRTDIYESNDEIVLVTDMPGVDEDTVDITLEKNVLTVNGFVEATEPEGYTLTYAEYRVGDYQRSFKLSSEIDQDKIDASLKDGVLQLRLPKVSPTTRKIAVKAN